MSVASSTENKCRTALDKVKESQGSIRRGFDSWKRSYSTATKLPTRLNGVVLEYPGELAVSKSSELALRLLIALKKCVADLEICGFIMLKNQSG